MAKISNGIDITIFSACKVSEVSGIPVLFLANPGVGKSTGVEYFARVRNRELILLRGNTETNESIMGYSVCPPNAEDNSSAIQLRPKWFQRLIDNHEAGKKSLLFLDEITTANEYTQAALLHLIFERKCGDEMIPDDTLIIAAGNYANNLSNSMVMLPPLLSRFMIINLTPGPDDLTDFLNKYDGSIAGQRRNHEKELLDLMKKIDEQEIKNLSEEQMNKIGEYIERNIRLAAKMLMTTGEKLIDLKVTELQNIYSDTSKDDPLANFVTLRTLNYYRDVTLAEYICFGKEGIKSDIYKNMTNGLVGLGVSRDSHGEVKYTPVANEFYNGMLSVVNEISKMDNDRLPKYEKFFNDITKGEAAKLESASINTITNKIRELRGDKELSSIERPIDGDVIRKICDSMVMSAKSFSRVKVDVSDKISDKIPVEKFNEYVSYWNYIADLMSEVYALVSDPSRGYKKEVKDVLSESDSNLRRSVFRLKSMKKAMLSEDKAFEKIILEIKSIKD